MALTISNLQKFVEGNWRCGSARVTFDSSYPTGGEELLPAKMGLHYIEQIHLTPDSDGADTTHYTFAYDKTNNKIQVYRAAAVAGTDATGSSGIVFDNDDAATDGVAVYVHVAETVLQEQAYLGHLEFVSPTNADGTGTIANGGATFRVLDDDAAATGGVALFVAPAGGGFYANIGATYGAVYIPLENGEFIKVTHDADPATNQTAVQVYFDEDGTNSYERLMSVVVDNANETFTCDDDRGWIRDNTGAAAAAPFAEVGAAVDLSAAAVYVVAKGR